MSTMDGHGARSDRADGTPRSPVFPEAGARARRLKRFERDLEDWLARPEGRFAQWRARRRLAAPESRTGVVSR